MTSDSTEPPASALSRLWAAFDFPHQPLARASSDRIKGAFYHPPHQRLIAYQPEQLLTVIDSAHRAACDGAWVLGGLRYEAASALDSSLSTAPSHCALAEFYIWHSAPEPWPDRDEACAPILSDWADQGEFTQQTAAIQRIHEWIEAGDCYQVNLTTRLKAQPSPDFQLSRYFLSLHEAQPAGFSLFLRNEGNLGGIASVSPELFFDWQPPSEHHGAGRISTQPMKGTAPRGTQPQADAHNAKQLQKSEKERAENLMIVDLLRNDLSRIALLGTVETSRLFELHALPTVWQMTSTVTAQTRPNTTLSTIFQALFPCGSVTGAPKVRSMQIIQELENPHPRGWYCGAVGLIQPGGACTFNVPIRTVEVNASGELLCGIGSGITFDSTAQDELAEWQTKRRFLHRAAAPIFALETLRLEQGHYQRLPLHIARMSRCAAHFGLQWCEDCVHAYLEKLAQKHSQGSWRVRLTLSRKGKLASQVQALEATMPHQPVHLALAPRPIPQPAWMNEFIFYKTTRREVYDAFQLEKPSGIFDWVLWNDKQELTEGTFGNIALELDGQWLTPASECGLLPGVMREELLQRKIISEAKLTIADLHAATQVAFFNSLRGWLKATVVDNL